MQFNWFLVFCLMFLRLAYSKSDYDIKKIFEISTKALESNDVKKNDEILRKFYFPGKKENSVWYLVGKEWKEMHGSSLGHQDLVALEKLIQRIYKTYVRCWEMEKGGAKAECFHGIQPILLRGNQDLKWNYVAGMSEEQGRGKYGLYFTAYTAMTVHITIVSLYNAKFFEHDKEAKKTISDFLSLNHNNGNTLVGYEDELMKLRTDKVTPVKICDVRYKLWQEYQGACEKRWRRSIEDLNEEAATEIMTTKKERESEDFKGQFHDNDPDLDVVDQLGNPVAKNKIRFHATVIDEVNQKNIFEKYQEGDHSKRGETMQVLVKEGIKKRSTYVKELVEKLEAFDNSTVKKVREMAKLLYSHLELKTN